MTNAAELTTYVRQAREHPAYQWWRLPVAGLLTVPLVLIASLAVFGIAWLAAPGPVGRFIETRDAELNVHSDPVVLAMGLLSVAVLLPCLQLAVLATGPRPIGHLSSVYGRLRWKWLLQSLAAGFVVMLGALLVLTLVIDPTPLKTPGRRALVDMAVFVGLTPIQAAAEEYVFRGYLMQLVGSWTTWAWVPVAVSVPLFALAHGYTPWATVDVGLFGLLACLLVLRTGGLEASIGLHIANNVSLGVLEGFGLVDTSDKGATATDVLPSVVTSLIFFALIEWMFRRSGLHRVRRRTPDHEVPPIGWTGEPAAV